MNYYCIKIFLLKIIIAFKKKKNKQRKNHNDHIVYPRTVASSRLKNEQLSAVKPTELHSNNERAVAAAYEFLTYQHKMREKLLPPMYAAYVDFLSSTNVESLVRKGYSYMDLRANKVLSPDLYHRKLKNVSYALASNRTFVRFDTTTKSWVTKDLPADVPYGVVSRDTEVLLDTQIIETHKDTEIKPTDLPVFFWLDGVAGCGKTQIICRTYVHGNDMVLAASTAAIEEIRNRLIHDAGLEGEKLKNFISDVQYTVRTVASATLMKRISLSFTKGM